jgi:hypothetical protein
LFFGKKNTIDGKTWLNKHYLDSAPAKSTIAKWFAKLKLREMCIEGDAHSGGLKEAFSKEDLKKVHKII